MNQPMQKWHLGLLDALQRWCSLLPIKRYLRGSQNARQFGKMMLTQLGMYLSWLALGCSRPSCDHVAQNRAENDIMVSHDSEQSCPENRVKIAITYSKFNNNEISSRYTVWFTAKSYIPCSRVRNNGTPTVMSRVLLFRCWFRKIT